MRTGWRTRPLLRGEEMRGIDLVRNEKAYPAKRQNQQRHSGRRGGGGKMPMSGLMMPMIVMVMIVMWAVRVSALL